MNGFQLKEQGQQIALFNSGDEWVSYILDKFRAFCKARKEMGMNRFRFEEFRIVAEQSGWDTPASSKVWGALPRRFCKEGLIRWTQKYEPAESKKTHGHPVKVWEAL
jgi:hypothetical protein